MEYYRQAGGCGTPQHQGVRMTAAQHSVPHSEACPRAATCGVGQL